MLARRFRLKSPAMFRRTLDAVKLSANRCFVAYGLKPKEGVPAQTRFGFIVSAKVSKRANKRNRLKRWFREIIRKEILPARPVLPYQSVVMIARSGMLDATYDEVRRLMKGCFSLQGEGQP